MSDQPTGMPAGEGQPSEEEVRAYLGQLRGAPVEQVVAEVVSALLNAAQVKLGRRDGRLLLDVTAATVDAGRAHLPSELTKQVDEALTQLRLAQVEAEKEVAQAAADGRAEAGDLAGGAEQAAAGDAPEPGQPPQDPPSPASRLWVPGR